MPRYREADFCVFGDVIGLPESRVQALPGIAYLVAAAIGGSQTRVWSSAEVEMNVENPLEVLQRRCVYSEIVLE